MGENDSSSDDEFEKEMEAELNFTIKAMEEKLSHGNRVFLRK